MNFVPPSLSKLFEPPEDYNGYFGWLCGYAADASFLEIALERFTRLTHAQRAYEGRIRLVAMLDPGNPQIAPAEVPGALHLPVRDAKKLPFELLHAKVAVLGFQRDDSFVLRVIVSTGNWTRQTLEESLDLAWHVNVGSGDAETEGIRQNRTDLAAAWDFLASLQPFFDLRLLERAAGENNDSIDAARRFTDWINKVGTPHRGYRPRFCDTRERSLIEQLPELVRHHAGDVSRNYLAVGSGFFQGEGSEGAFVPDQIFSILQVNKLVTRYCEKNLFVNPLNCQSVAKRQDLIEQNGWAIRAAHTPVYFGAAPRSLHAKFIFSANYRDSSNKCGAAWIYLGSSNLTNPGFMKRPLSGGNLEAGVVFAPEAVRWSIEDKNDNGANVISNLLPIHWEDPEKTPLPELNAGQDMPERDEAFVEPPVAIFLWEERPKQAILTPQGAVLGKFDLLDPDMHKCEPLADGSFTWLGKQPRQVTVAWFDGTARTANVPVIDRHGRFCATELPALDLEEARIQLASFPMPPEDEELAGSDSADVIDGVLGDGVALATTPSTYPTRRMMMLVENIAAKQVNISEPDWATWCNRLEQLLSQAKDSADVKAFRSIELNPLSPLFASAFRPAFAVSKETQHGARYEEALNAVIAAWQLEGYDNLGEPS